MAKKKQGSKKQGGTMNTSQTSTNLTPKGMIKDADASYLGDKNWSHAINAINNSVDGDTGVIGNEPANLSCAETPYPIIGAIHTQGDKWVLFLTNDLESEIGVFDDSKCEYQRLINDRCLDFKLGNLVVGAFKENFDCTRQVYWDDGRNPSRTLNIDDIPWDNHEDSIPGAPCVTYEDDNPLRLNCEKIRLAPLMDIPCVTLSKAPEGGSLRNGSYQVYFAYAVNDQVIGDYVGISNIQPIWSHEDTSGSVDINITNIDKDFEQYVIVMIMKHQGGQIAKRLGIYSTEQSDINIDFINPSLTDVDIADLPLRREAYEKSSGMYVVNDYLIRTNPVEQFDFNYQPLANNITTEWVSAQYPAEYYKNGGNKPTFVRDEQYAFFIRFIYNTGERSSSYHIPGRAPQAIGAGGHPAAGNMENAAWGSNINSIDSTDKVFEVYNTAGISATGLNIPTEDGGMIKARGPMGYWESTEKYPATDPARWAGLCGLPIRHHKIPDETLVAPGNPTHLSTPDGQYINILGVQFSDIAAPLDNNGNIIRNIQGYEILVGGREGNKTIIAKGIIRNMMEYESLDGDGNEGSGSVTHLMPNYPYNDLGTDPFLMPPGNGNSAPNWYNTPDHWLSGNESTRVGAGSPGLNTVASDTFTFHSPETQFEKIYLNPYEIKTYGTLNGLSSGHFKPSEEHPKQKLLQNTAAVIGAVIGIGYAFSEMRGKRNVKNTSGKSLSLGIPPQLKTITETNVITTVNTYALANQHPYGAGFTTGLITNTGSETNTPVYQPLTGGATPAITPFPNAIANAASSPSASSSGASTAVSNSAVDLTAPLGGSRLAESLAVPAWGASQATAAGLMPGHIGPGVEYTYEGSKYKSVPTPLALLTGMMSFLNYVSTGGQEIVDLIYNLMSYHHYAYKYNSHGFYSTIDPFGNSVQFRTNIQKGMYVGSNLQNFTGNIKINNLHRPNTVVLQTGGNNLPTPSGTDNSKFIIGDTIGNCDWYEPSTEVTRSISANYVSLKVENDNQYGQLQNINQFPVRGCTYSFIDQQKEDADGNIIPIIPADRFTTTALFGGDNYINRYTEKVIMPFWWNFMKGEPDGTPFDYRLYTNVPIPRFWMNTEKYRLDELTKPLSNFTFNFSDALPSSLFHLDRHPSSIYSGLFGGLATGLFSTGSMNQTPGGLFTIQNGYMYTHNSGIQDFFVESEINLALRDYGDDSEKRHYDKYEFTDVNELFHADHIKKGNYYKYDKGLSKKYFQLGVSASFGELQPSWYDPIIAETCWTEYPKRLIYSLQATKEAKKDFWRVFLPENHKDFKDKVTTIKGISQLGAIMLFPTLSPRLFTGVDTIQTNSTKFTIGDGGLFNKEPQNISNSDISHEYGSCESARSVTSTPAGVFYVSQAQGKIFQYGGKGLSPISDQGMKWWFNKYLPSQLLAQFPTIEDCPQAVDNPLNGAGCQTIYDPNNDIVYFSKRDYVLKEQWKANVDYYPCLGFFYRDEQGEDFPVYIDDEVYFEDISWTVSYDPKSKAWVSFHDWHPEISMNSINHFMTTQTTTTDTPQCPPGYTFDATTGDCCVHVEETNVAHLNISEVLAQVASQDAVVSAFSDPLDIVFSIDMSGSTAGGNLWQTQGQFVERIIELLSPGMNTDLTLAPCPINTQPAGTGVINVGVNIWSSALQLNATSGALVGDPCAAISWTNTNATSAAAPAGGNLTSYNIAVTQSMAQLSGPGSNPTARKMVIFITDSGCQSCTDDNCNGGAMNTTTQTPAWMAANFWGAGIESKSVFSSIGAPAAGWQANSACLVENPPNEQFAVTPATFDLVAVDIINSLVNCDCDTANGFTMDVPTHPCSPDPSEPIPNCVKCSCPTGYTLIPGQTCTSVDVPICKKVSCDCYDPPNPQATFTVTGTCPTPTTPDWLAAGNPGWANPDPVLCHWVYDDCVLANYTVGGIWKHNVRTDKFANFYGEDFPWEVDLLQASGQVVNTIRNVEYALESYVYKNDGRDRFHVLDYNFDEAEIYNTEQTSGLLKLNITPKNNAPLITQYPIINAADIDILYSKEEQKYRFNQFWDVTNDRGEFTGAQEPVYITRLNGYIRDLNMVNININKPAFERKKFRHYYNHVILRRSVSNDHKMLLRLMNTKINTSQR